jgi:hypothetical protein
MLASLPLGMARAGCDRHDPRVGNGECRTAADATPCINKPLRALSSIGGEDDPGAATIQGNDMA